MSIAINFHGVTAIHTQLVRHDGRTWRRLTITCADGTEQEMDLWPFDRDRPLVVEDLDARQAFNPETAFSGKRNELDETTAEQVIGACSPG